MTTPSVLSTGTELDSIEDALQDIQAGRMVIVVDEEDRENEGDLTMAAENVTPEAINFMATHGRGLICLPMTGEALEGLKVPLMWSRTNRCTRLPSASVSRPVGECQRAFRRPTGR